MNETEKLLPCPFYGSAGIAYDDNEALIDAVLDAAMTKFDSRARTVCDWAIREYLKRREGNERNRETVEGS